MTSLINLRSGGKTEARIGDVVLLGDGNKHTVNSVCDAELYDSECTLISREFQDGDKIQGCGKVTYCWYNDTYHKGIEAQYLDIRYTNPDWREE